MCCNVSVVMCVVTCVVMSCISMCALDCGGSACASNLDHCNTLQHTEHAASHYTKCNTEGGGRACASNLYYCNTPWHTATICNTLQQLHGRLWRKSTCMKFWPLQHTATPCNTMQHTAHTATHLNACVFIEWQTKHLRLVPFSTCLLSREKCLSKCKKKCWFSPSVY